LNLELDPELDKAIDELVAGGGYDSRQEVVREAVELLKSREVLRLQSLDRLRREVRIGIERIERGEIFDAEEVFEELLKGLPDPDDAAA
jgi:putative addiction module CopG family antidote